MPLIHEFLEAKTAQNAALARPPARLRVVILLHVSFFDEAVLGRASGGARSWSLATALAAQQRQVAKLEQEIAGFAADDRSDRLEKEIHRSFSS